jgi:hypothetical protein
LQSGRVISDPVALDSKVHYVDWGRYTGNEAERFVGVTEQENHQNRRVENPITHRAISKKTHIRDDLRFHMFGSSPKSEKAVEAL